MNKRPLIYLTIALIGAAVVLLIDRPERPRVGDVSEGYFIPNYDSADIARVEIRQLLDGCELVRNGDSWLVSEKVTHVSQDLMEKEGQRAPEPKWFQADPAQVTSALGAFGGLDPGVVVSDNPERRSLYQVDSKGAAVRAFDSKGNEIVGAVIGKNGPDFASTYIRPVDGDKVYLVHRSIVGMFSPRASDWRERKMWAIDPSTISAINVVSPKEKWAAVRDEGGNWKMASASEAVSDQNKLRDLISKVAHLSAEDFADDIDTKSAGLDVPYLTISIKYGDGKSSTLAFGGKDSRGRYYAKLEGKDQIYLITSSFAETIPAVLPK